MEKIMKSCNNFSKQHSNLRAIPRERMPFDYQKSKQEMKRSIVLQKGQSARYQAEQKRYHQSVSLPIPQFEEPVMTKDTLGVVVVTSTTNMLSALTVTALVSESPAYVINDIMVRTTKCLVAPPQTPEEHYIATGGIIPYRKREEDSLE